MIRADSYQEVEGGGQLQLCPAELSGIRAIKMNALGPLYRGSERWVEILGESRNAPEEALETLIPDSRKKEVNGLGIISRQRGKGMTPLDQIVEDTFRVADAKERRDDLAKRVRELRGIAANGMKTGDDLSPTAGEISKRLAAEELDRIRDELNRRRRQKHKLT